MNEAVVAMPEDRRLRFTFKVPDSVRQVDTDPSTVTFVHLRVSDELEASKLSDVKGTGSLGFVTEAIRRSVVAINGKPINWNSAGLDGPEWYERTSPPVRNLLKTAFNKVHSAGEEAEDAFLASMAVEAQ